MALENNKKITMVVKALLEGDVSGLGQGVLQPNIPADPDVNPTQEPAQSNQQVINNTESAQNPNINQDNQQLPQMQAGEDLQLEQQIKGPEDPIKKFIDKLIDTKNKVYEQNSKSEIQKTISNINT